MLSDLLTRNVFNRQIAATANPAYEKRIDSLHAEVSLAERCEVAGGGYWERKRAAFLFHNRNGKWTLTDVRVDWYREGSKLANSGPLSRDLPEEIAMLKKLH